MVVVVERRHELMGLPTVKPVPTVEAAGERPRRPRRGHVRLVVRREVPLADRVRRVADGAQRFREKTVLARDSPAVPGISHGKIRDATHPVAVVVAAGEEARARRRAQRGRVEVGEPHPVVRERVERGRRDVGAVAAELREPDVVEHEHQHVRRARGRFGIGWPPRCRRSPVSSDHTLEFRAHGPESARRARPCA